MSERVVVERYFTNDKRVDVVKLHVGDGDYVQKGEPLADVEASKATVNVVAPAPGYVLLQCSVGDTVEVGDLLAIISPNAPSQADAPRIVRPTKAEVPRQAVPKPISRASEPPAPSRRPPKAAPVVTRTFADQSASPPRLSRRARKSWNLETAPFRNLSGPAS